jgi:phosphate:Na+ symporter
MTTLEILKIIASMLGGLALFLAGMSMMSDSLASMTGGSLDHLIDRVTKNKFLAFLFGAVLTALVQSASATTVLTVGLVNSGMIEFTKAIGLIIGANLGTTATAWVLSLNAIGGESLIMTIIKPSFFSPFLGIIGVGMTMFSRSAKKKTIGSALLGFAIMMIGMNLMSQAVAPLKEIPAITDILMKLSNPVLGFLFACAFAMLVQSSDAVIGIVQAFALSIGITYGMAIPLICGAQVGTCITSLISSLGASNNGKRTALLNLYYNLLKTIPFMVIFYALNAVMKFSFMDQSVGGIGIPVVHTCVNLFGSAVWLPLSGVIVRLAQKTIPLSEREKQEQANTLTMLDENLLAMPGLALMQADRAVTLLSDTVGQTLQTVMFLGREPEKQEEAQILCERSLRYEEQIDEYLVQISARELGKVDSAAVALLTAGNTAFGRMGRVADRLLGMISELRESAEQMTEQDRREILIVGEAIQEVIQLTFKGYKARTPNISRTIRCYTEEVMALGDIVKKRFMKRVHEDGRQRSGSTLFTDICYAEEQLVDYCDMIAEALIRYDRENGESRQGNSVSDQQLRRQVHEMFRDKFEELERA